MKFHDTIQAARISFSIVLTCTALAVVFAAVEKLV